jgi:hypothetical protein
VVCERCKTVGAHGLPLLYDSLDGVYAPLSSQTNLAIEAYSDQWHAVKPRRRVPLELIAQAALERRLNCRARKQAAKQRPLESEEIKKSSRAGKDT